MKKAIWVSKNNDFVLNTSWGIYHPLSFNFEVLSTLAEPTLTGQTWLYHPTIYILWEPPQMTDKHHSSLQ